MRTKLKVGLMAVAAVTVAALALAVRVNAQPAGPDNPGDETIAQQPATLGAPQNIPPRWLANQVRRAPGPYDFVMHPNVDVNVTENDNGVTIHLTTENADIAKRLQENLPGRIERLREQARKLEGRREEIEKRREERGLEVPKGPNLLASDKVRVQVVPTDKGVDILMASDDPDVVAQIKQTVPQHIENAKRLRKRMQVLRQQIAEHPGAMLREAQVLNLMFSPEVQTKLTPTDKGVIIELSSDNPQIAEKLKTVLPQRLYNVREVRESTGEAGLQHLVRQGMMQQPERMEGPGPMGFGGRGEGQMLGREARPAEERMRQMIREELRRYFEEKGEEEVTE